MERIKLHFPHKVHFSYQIPVLIQHINYGNHVGNDSVVSILHDARVRFLKHYNYTELNIEALGIIMSDLTISFKNQIFYTDTLQIDIALNDFSHNAFELYYQISIPNKNNIVAVIAKSTMIFFDYEKQCIAKTPINFLEKFTI